MELLTQRLASLLTVKSLEQFLTVFTVVIAFYFGTQAEKRARA